MYVLNDIKFRYIDNLSKQLKWIMFKYIVVYFSEQLRDKQSNPIWTQPPFRVWSKTKIPDKVSLYEL
jgi:hypothetical protein